jgi:hypothetical protein
VFVRKKKKIYKRPTQKQEKPIPINRYIHDLQRMEQRRAEHLKMRELLVIAT